MEDKSAQNHNQFLQEFNTQSISPKEGSKPSLRKTSKKKKIITLLAFIALLLLLSIYMAYKNIFNSQSLDNSDTYDNSATLPNLQTYNEDVDNIDLPPKGRLAVYNSGQSLDNSDTYDNSATLPNSQTCNEDVDNIDLPPKDSLAVYNHEESLRLANEYLDSNSYLKSSNLSAHPNTMVNSTMLKESSGVLVYEFDIQPESDSSEIEKGRIWINTLTGTVYLVDVVYKDETYSGGMYRRSVSEDRKVNIDAALSNAVEFAHSNQIGFNEDAFQLVKTNEDRLGAFEFKWDEKHNNIITGSLTISIHFDGKFQQMIFKKKPVPESLSPATEQKMAEGISISCLLTKDYSKSVNLSLDDISVSETQLILSPVRRDVHWTKQVLAWHIILQINDEEKQNTLNRCGIHVYVNAQTGKVLYPSYDYNACRIY